MDADRSRDEVRGALNAQAGGGGGKVSVVTPSDGAGGLDIKRPTHTPPISHYSEHSARRESGGPSGGRCFHLQRTERAHGAAGGHEPGRSLAAPPPFRTPSSVRVRVCVGGGSNLRSDHLTGPSPLPTVPPTRVAASAPGSSDLRAGGGGEGEEVWGSRDASPEREKWTQASYR